MTAKQTKPPTELFYFEEAKCKEPFQTSSPNLFTFLSLDILSHNVIVYSDNDHHLYLDISPPVSYKIKPKVFILRLGLSPSFS